MKNIIIIVLVVALAVLGTLFFVNREADNSVGTTTPSSETVKNIESTGKEIDLASKGLSELTKAILDDKSVTKLDVSNNNLTGSLPAEIRKLTNLEVLLASNNKMTGVPAEIGQLSKLKYADFSNNNLSGLPLEIGNLSKLETIDFRGNPNISKYDISLIQPKIPNAKILVD